MPRSARGHIIIEVMDDGKGIDSDVVLERARMRGLVSPDKTLTEAETYALLFEPGFSTAKVVDEVSGRGVGLDVVRQNIENLKGVIDIDSVLGKGDHVSDSAAPDFGDYRRHERPCGRWDGDDPVAVGARVTRAEGWSDQDHRGQGRAG